ncbi:hypothetical protein PVBG_04213, partial [Plasmodium vivax Brazil I]
MVVHKNDHVNHNSKSQIIIKIVIFIVLSWLCQFYNDMSTQCKSLENKPNIILDIRTHRSLAKHERKNELRNSRIHNQTHYDGEDYKLVNARENNNTYAQIKRESKNHMDVYLKNYHQRYAKKKGLKKLDCYYEKKFFKFIDKMEKQLEHKKIDRKRFKKMLYKLYGIPLFILSLIPLLGFILPMIFWEDTHIGGVRTTCRKLSSTGGSQQYHAYNHEKCSLVTDVYMHVNFALTLVLALTIILLIFYLIIKVAKYER